MSTSDVLLIKAPDAWPVPVVATLAMVLLAGLDLAGALFAKEWAENGSIRSLVLGAGAFLVLFWVYASSLQYAELAVVTMGWIVLLQVGILVIDRIAFDSALPAGKLAAVVIILAAQGYLVLAPSGPTA